MTEPGTLLLSRSEITKLLTLEECIAAVEEAFRRHGAGEVSPPGILGTHVPAGGFHVKSGLWDNYYAVKVNANFPGNPTTRGLPAIQGLILLYETESGRPLAVMDSAEITALRTAAATAVAARYLSHHDSTVLTLCGCGNQGRMQVRAVCHARPLQRVFVYDMDAAKARSFAAETAENLGVEVEAVEDLRTATRQSDIVVTCTPSRKPLLGIDDVRLGAFIAGVGADSPEKNELDPALLAAGRVVVDVLEQAVTIGDLQHAIAAGKMTRERVHAELGQVVAGRRPGRASAPASSNDIWVFDSTGMALQDAAAAALVYHKATHPEEPQESRQNLHFSY